MQGQAEQWGRVRVAPAVLATITSLAALGVPGVAAMSPGPGGIGRILGRGEVHHGVRIEMRDDENAVIDVHLVVRRDVSMLQVGRLVQREIVDAFRQTLGMAVAEVNVYIQDVEI